MPNCLGIYIEKNLIKYAKISKDRTNSEDITSYGIDFYDGMLLPAVKKIIQDTNSGNDLISINLSKEEYVPIDVFSRLSEKDMRQLLTTEFETYCNSKGIPETAVEMRYILVKNTGKPDSYKAICISANKAELADLWQTFSNEKLASIASLGVIISNLLRNKGITENAAVVNIEDRTTITIFARGEICKITTLPIGMEDVLEKLSTKYNSYAKAYEACKKISAYTELGFEDSLTDEDREIMDVLLPTLYDIRERVVNAIEEKRADISKIYLTGTATIVNNLDLYFQEYITDKKCEILRPYFVSKDQATLKDIIEVNSAVAVALNAFPGYVDKNTDFYTAKTNSFLGWEAFKKRTQEIKMDEVKLSIENWFNDISKKSKEKIDKLTDKTKRKIDIESDEGQQYVSTELPPDYYEKELNGEANGRRAENGEESKETSPFTNLDLWLVRLAVTLFVALAVYSGISIYTTNLISEKIALAENNKLEVQGAIDDAVQDAAYIKLNAAEYGTKREKLQNILSKINDIETRAYNIPNFLSQIMFIVPSGVKINNIVAEQDRTVTITAQSGKYAELGYFVSRLKLESILINVGMKVVDMSSNIVIEISGVLP